jgi:hypothetical protein
LLVINPLFKVEKRIPGIGFHMYSPSTGVIDNGRATSTGNVIVISGYGSLGAWGAITIAVTAPTPPLIKGDYVEVQWVGTARM